LELTSVCAPKVIQEVNFPKHLWGFMPVMDCSCAHIFLRRQMALQQTAKFWTTLLVNFYQFEEG